MLPDALGDRLAKGTFKSVAILCWFASPWGDPDESPPDVQAADEKLLVSVSVCHHDVHCGQGRQEPSPLPLPPHSQCRCATTCTWTRRPTSSSSTTHSMTLLMRIRSWTTTFAGHSSGCSASCLATLSKLLPHEEGVRLQDLRGHSREFHHQRGGHRDFTIRENAGLWSPSLEPYCVVFLNRPPNCHPQAACRHSHPCLQVADSGKCGQLLPQL